MNEQGSHQLIKHAAIIVQIRSSTVPECSERTAVPHIFETWRLDGALTEIRFNLTWTALMAAHSGLWHIQTRRVRTHAG